MSTISCQKDYSIVVTTPNPGGYPSGPLQVDSTTLAFLNHYANTAQEGLSFSGVLQRIDPAPHTLPMYKEILSGAIPTNGGNGPGDSITVSKQGNGFVFSVGWNYNEFSSMQVCTPSTTPIGNYVYAAGTNLAFFPNPASPVVIT